MKNLFYNLTPDIIIQAVEKQGFKPSGHCLALNSYENRVFDLRLEDGNHIITKFYRPGRWSQEQIEEEHSFIWELETNEIPVCAPIRDAKGASLHETEGIYYALWHRTGGRQTDEFSDDELAMLGRLIARIHTAGASKGLTSRRTLNGDTYAREPLAFLLKNSFIPEHFAKRYSDAVLEIADLYDTLSREIPMHRIHGDCHQGNLLKGREGYFFLDFDDFCNGPAVQDTWMLLPVTDREGLRQREVFLEGYRTFSDFDSSWLRLIEPLRALRYIHYAGWIARRWNDPAFPHIFPHFGTETYWEHETIDIEEQLLLIKDFEKNSAHLYTADSEISMEDDEEELTNKDLFWDWEE